eukprot:460844-Amphidinium_carterae.1
MFLSAFNAAKARAFASLATYLLQQFLSKIDPTHSVARTRVPAHSTKQKNIFSKALLAETFCWNKFQFLQLPHPHPQFGVQLNLAEGTYEFASGMSVVRIDDYTLGT